MELKLFWKCRDFFSLLTTHKKITMVFIIMSFIFLIILGCIVENYERRLEQEKIKHGYTIVKKDIAIKRKGIAEKENRIRLAAINEKVNALHDFLSRFYKGYDYKSKIDEALKDDEKTTDLPEDLFSIYIQNYLIGLHGTQQYTKVFPDMIFPLNEKTSFMSCKQEEFGYYRPYNKIYKYKHLGTGWNCFDDNSVYAVYDMIIFKKYYSHASGYVLEAKAKYKDKEGNIKYIFIRYMHLDEINSYVKVGDVVKKGSVIATLASTGYLSTGTHCHLEVYTWNGSRYVPVNFVKNSTYNNKVYRSL